MAAKAFRVLRAFRGHAKNLAQTAKSGNIKITKSLANIAKTLWRVAFAQPIINVDPRLSKNSE